jgi:hypothetical protein
MRLLRKHYEPAEKMAGYDCIRHYVERYSHSAECKGTFGDTNDICNIHGAFNTFFQNIAWPGGYTIAFITDDGAVLCADCAKRAFITDRIDITADCYDEGPTLYCDGCNCEIVSSYGDPETDGDA